MNKLMQIYKSERFRKIISYVCAVYMFLAALVFFPSWPTLLMILTGIVALPVGPLYKLLHRIGIHGVFRMILVLVLFTISFLLVPLPKPVDVMQNSSTLNTSDMSDSFSSDTASQISEPEETSSSDLESEAVIETSSESEESATASSSSAVQSAAMEQPIASSAVAQPSTPPGESNTPCYFI